MSRIADLTAKLAASLEREQHALREISQLTQYNTDCLQEIDCLQALLDEREEGHNAASVKETTRSFKAGHNAAIKEMKDLWSSKEYAAELMYGTKQSFTLPEYVS